MTPRQISFLCLLLSLFAVATSSPVKELVSGNEKSGKCPPERYFNRNDSQVCHKLCQNDFSCEGNMKCCPDNCDMMCKPPAQEKPGACPNFPSTGIRCNDNCTSDSECRLNQKCCPKSCGKTCVPNAIDIGKPPQVSTTKGGFCFQESVYNCGLKERISCDENSCLEGYKCCPKICRVECQKALEERNGKCPAADTECPAGIDPKICQSDYDCNAHFKCCSTKCGMKCVQAQNVTSFLHSVASSSFNHA